MDDLFLMRGIERLTIVLGGIALAYLGYKLYLHGASSSESRMNFSSQFMKFAASGTGPGLLFMAFGSIILVCSLVFGGVSSLVRTRDSSTERAVSERAELEKHALPTAATRSVSDPANPPCPSPSTGQSGDHSKTEQTRTDQRKTMRAAREQRNAPPAVSERESEVKVRSHPH
jgi:hypothetical protein